MKVVDTVERVVLYLLAIPIALIIIRAILNFFDAREGNAVVSFFRSTAETFSLSALNDMFADQGNLQDVALQLAFYGLLVLAVIIVFRVIRAIVTSAQKSRKTD
jgi:hypothetical protein